MPPLSYRIPEHLEGVVRVGSLVVAPLSGYSRLGVVVSVDGGDHASEYLRSVPTDYSLPHEIVELCCWASEAGAVPLSSAIRAALPPGLNTGCYRVLAPLPGWPWEVGKLASRSALRRTLGGEGLKAAEKEGRVELILQKPGRRMVEWAMIRTGSAPDLGRAPRQRELFAALEQSPEGRPVRELLSEPNASRAALRALVGRGAIRLEKKSEPPPVLISWGEPDAGVLRPLDRQVGRVVDVGGAWIWRVPTAHQPGAVVAVARAVVEEGEQILILAPEIEAVERLARLMQELLPAGYSVATYHSGLGRDRASIYEAARRREVDVLVGTRSAALIPMPRLGAICVVDEPNEGHRAEPGYEGLPIHVRELVRERGWIEGAGTLFLSPHPSLRLYAEKPGVRELPPRPAREWPSASIVDIRGSGASLSPTMLETCKRTVEAGGRVGVIANRLGYATSVSCNACGTVLSCPDCELPLVLHGATLVCSRCGYSERFADGCGGCGSGRLTPTGLAVERVREEVSRALGCRVGLLTAAERDQEDAPIVVGTSRCVTSEEWDVVAVTDVDALLQGSGMSSVERAFRMIYAAAEASRERLIVQTRSPGHYALQAALRGDYTSFAAAELPRLHRLGYPPYGHLASLTLEGSEDAVRGAVESRLRSAIEPDVMVSAPAPARSGGKSSAWRVLLRSRDREAVSRAGALAAHMVRDACRLKAHIEIDPEEV
ncbi:MAG: hypothetical protein M3157_00050 [Actinomycetota bacterium]|nr:hypothetical protein [Actinomycetota bacterium]